MRYVKGGTFITGPSIWSTFALHWLVPFKSKVTSLGMHLTSEKSGS